MSRRGVWDLKRITLRYSLNAGSSRGVREYIDKGNLFDFAKSNPQFLIQTLLRPSGHPFLVAKYRNGYKRQIGLKNTSPEEIQKVMRYVRSSLGHQCPKHGDISLGVVKTNCPSLQGYWRVAPHSDLVFGKTWMEQSESPEVSKHEKQFQNLFRTNHNSSHRLPSFDEIQGQFGLYGATKLIQKLLQARVEDPTAGFWSQRERKIFEQANLQQKSSPL